METIPEGTWKDLDRLRGTWATRATHVALPGVVVLGTMVIEWLEGNQFLVCRVHNDHPDFPDSLSLMGVTDLDRVEGTAGAGTATAGGARLRMHYYDSRGVFRVYDASIDGETWRLWRDAPGFSQRFTGTFADDGTTIVGRWQLRVDDINWEDDLDITYRRT